MRPAAQLAVAPKRLRCAIYTRKSSEEGLDQEFNSLHAQRDSCEAYVLSQTGEGWTALPTAYDDGGYSGGNIDRPGLVQLMADVDAGRIDVVVVYKVDRLTRSLADFAKIVERFDAKGVSFVSVTQAFNTTSSMGRLTLNVLLSFAQFEREVTGERIRDKIAASKAKGLWMGGRAAFGYDPDGRTLKPNREEADEVRHIFRRYLETRSVHALCKVLEEEGVKSRVSVTKKGVTQGGVAFSRGPLFHLLRNPVYVGEIPHRDMTYPGQHAPIVDRALYDAVQASLLTTAQSKRRRAAGLEPLVTSNPLAGKVRDDAGNPMSPVSARKGRSRIYRYYVSTAIQQGRPEKGGSLGRLPAPELEALVRDRALALGVASSREPAEQAIWDRVRAVEVGRRRVVIRFHADIDDLNLDRAPEGDEVALLDDELTIAIPITLKTRGGAKIVTGPRGAAAINAAPTIDLPMLKALVQAEAWKTALLAGEYTSVEAIAKERGFQAGYAQRIIRLAFLSPSIKRAIT